MVKNFFKVLLFAVLCFLIVEQSYRVYSVGLVAFNPWRLNSLTGIFNSGLIELSEDPEIYYELKPNLDNYFKGARLTTSSIGLADKEYSLEKPEDTLRIAVVGSSWSMASGVPTDRSYHAILEERLNLDPALPNIEIINFSVEYYSLREIVAIARKKVLAWNPDIIIVAVTFTTASLSWDGIIANRELPPKNNPFFTSFALRAITGAMGIKWIGSTDPRREALGKYGMGVFRDQLTRSLREINAAADPEGARTMLLWLAFEPLQGKVLADVKAMAEDTGVIVVRGEKPLMGTKREQEALRISRFDRHPNELAHSKIADELESALIENDLLPPKVDL